MGAGTHMGRDVEFSLHGYNMNWVMAENEASCHDKWPAF